MAHDVEAAGGRDDRGAGADIEGLQRVRTGPAIVDNRLRRVDADLDGVVLVESLERAGDLIQRLRLRLQRRDEGALLQLGLLLEADLPPALARLGAADVLSRPMIAPNCPSVPPRASWSRSPAHGLRRSCYHRHFSAAGRYRDALDYARG
jgi:hypothetical protein